MTADSNTQADNPRQCRMAMQISPKALDVTITPVVADTGLRQFSIPLNPSEEPLKALEDAIYSTPDILADYDRVDLLIRTEAYTVVPPGMSREGAEACARITMIPGNDDCPVVTVDRHEIADVVWSAPANIMNFLARTFRNAPVKCHITPLIHYLARRASMSSNGRLYAHFAGDRVDLIGFDAECNLIAAVTHTIASDTDALYFIMAVARQSGIDVVNDEILLGGDASRRLSMMPVLSRYAAKVLPVIFPSAALRAGREAIKAPFPLIILPLCE